MRIRYRLILAGAGVLAVTLGGVEFWPQPEPAPLPAAMLAMAVPPAPPPPAPPPGVVPVNAAEVPAPAPPREVPQVTVARMALEPVAPEPEDASPPRFEDNDDIEPELPQTAQWELEKTARVAALVERDVVRLAREREDAAAQGDVRRGEQLDVLLQRSLEQLRELHEEVRRLAAVVNSAGPTK
ncbi:hypothetical protein [Myxococcus sp. SDU36]|uniref:hypothetical protein n=1 Tax=Myxococcus sp. SDU36 TaxID=2831967 RepID=UPI0025430E70|nr:hypothetical protein [Myxococcus sp. SDU36]WIG93738.1 hypothetical protein KGD87_24590 [Myxococcus sp. SDU36]